MKSEDIGAFSEEMPEVAAELEEASVPPEQADRSPALAEEPLVEIEEPDSPVEDVEEPAEASNEADDSTEPLAVIDPKISAEVERIYREVPEIGTKWRWYDWPYRALDIVGPRRKYWTKVPKPVRRSVNRAQNWLRLFNHYDREKITSLVDPLDNILVPDGEKISLPCFWLVEYYSPSHAKKLMRRISSPKWTRTDFGRPDSPDVAVRQGRQREGGLGWQTIATLVRPDFEGFYPGSVRRRLPEQFRSISLSLLPLGSALTAVVARFDLTEAAAGSVDDVLRAEYQPRVVRNKGRLGVQQRLFVSLETVQSKREDLHQAGRDWLARELPGLFAVEAKASHPTLDMLFTQRFNPFRKDRRDRNEMNFERALGLDQEPFSLMHSPEWKRVRVMEYRFENIDHEPRDTGLALVARYKDALGRKKDFKHRGDERSEHAITGEIGYGAPGLLTRYGLFELLRVKQNAVARARDQASSLHSRRPVTSAKKLRKSVLRSSIDMATIARDIETLTASPYRYEWEVPELASRRREGEGWSKSEKGLLKKWAKRQAKEARRLADLDKELLGILDLASNLNATIEGIRSQRWSLFVGILSLASSGAAVWFAYLALKASTATGGG